jgi:hypothetical protein
MMNWKPYPPAACYWRDGIRQHVFFGPDARVCDCGAKTIVLDAQGRVIDETVAMTPSELVALAAACARHGDAR